MADGTDPSQQELSHLELVGQKLWDLDDNRWAKHMRNQHSGMQKTG
jgi:hypothetical protein